MLKMRPALVFELPLFPAHGFRADSSHSEGEFQGNDWLLGCLILSEKRHCNNPQRNFEYPHSRCRLTVHVSHSLVTTLISTVGPVSPEILITHMDKHEATKSFFPSTNKKGFTTIESELGMVMLGPIPLSWHKGSKTPDDIIVIICCTISSHMPCLPPYPVRSGEKKIPAK